MISTRNRNSFVDYSLFKRENKKILDYRLDSNRRFAEVNAFPLTGINMGHMPNTVFSKDATDIESILYGINFTNLVENNREFTPRFKQLKTISFFDRPNVYLPDPLVIEKNQRPIRP